jgi:hypothetical protein
MKLNHNMQSKFFLRVFVFLFIAGLFLILPRDAEAVSQWTRKYEVDCTTCHTAFPRLTHFGEKFMRNGFQWPDDEPDGDTAGKNKISDSLFADKVGNWLGARLSLTPGVYKTNGVTIDGVTEDSFNIGNPNWLQLFVAGTIVKNVSIFIEQEFEVDGSKFSWFHLFFTNLADTYVNFQVGKLSPVDFTPFPDRLRNRLAAQAKTRLQSGNLVQEFNIMATKDQCSGSQALITGKTLLTLIAKKIIGEVYG